MMLFYEWLGLQTSRRDPVGDFARYARKDKVFPIHARKLHLFLLRYEGLPLKQALVKRAHREWRRNARVRRRVA